eukprot:1917058-Prymnesium_polylepis.2
MARWTQSSAACHEGQLAVFIYGHDSRSHRACNTGLDRSGRARLEDAARCVGPRQKVDRDCLHQLAFDISHLCGVALRAWGALAFDVTAASRATTGQAVSGRPLALGTSCVEAQVATTKRLACVRKRARSVCSLNFFSASRKEAWQV